MIANIEALPTGIYEREPDQNILDANLEFARANRARLDIQGCTAIDIMGSNGSGKTTLIAQLIEKLKREIGVAVINADASPSTDTDIIAKNGVPLIQIATVNGCHLDAGLVNRALDKINLNHTSLIFVENVGNLISPADYPLGSKARVVVVSVTEGAHTIKKHPHMFLGADIVVINKIDLAGPMGVSIEDLIRDVHAIKPEAQVIPASCKFDAGVNDIAAAILMLA